MTDDTDTEFDEVRRNVSETNDPLRAEQKIKRGSGTRDQESAKFVAKGDDPEAVVEDLAAMIDEYIAEVGDDVRNFQPELAEADDE